MVRLLVGLLKGVVVGAGLGFGAFQIGLSGHLGYLVFGLIGLAVGLVAGRPIWSHLLDKTSTVWTAVLKGLMGFGVGAGLYALGHAALGDPSLAIAGETRPLTAWTYLFGGIVGALYGAWVEVDDAPAKKEPSK